jgi:hypothetical protein
MKTCSLCGYEYEAGAVTACQSCPLHGGCALACCPRCGYQEPDLERSAAAGWLRRILLAAPHPAAAPPKTGGGC